MSEEYRIAIIGQAAFGESVLKALLEQGENVVGVFCPPDAEGRPVDPIKALAEARRIPVHQFKRMRRPEAIEAFRSLNADLSVMAFVTDIVPEEILTAPKQGTIQYHPSLLPKHRGPSSINWPIIQGETKTGLSIFWPDAGLDTGPILLQKEVEIGPDDTLGTVYFDNLFPMGVDAMVESVRLVRQGNAPRIEQDESEMTYEGWCRAPEVVLDWSRPIDDVYNMIRGADPSPGAGSVLNGEAVQFYAASKSTESTDAEPGTVIGVSEGAVTIAANGGRLNVKRLKSPGQKKLNADQWAAENGVRTGVRFGT